MNPGGGSNRNWRLLLVVTLICAFASPVDRAQAGQTAEASIIGRVTDESSGVLPGVTVTVSSPALQVRQTTAVTVANGEYRLSPLPIGVYTVEFTLSGFQTERREGVRLTVGFVAKIDVALKVGSVVESVTVSGASPVVDVKSTAAGTLVTREVLDSVATGRNGIHSILTLGAGSRPALDVGRVDTNDPFFRAFGRSNQAWVLVDGVATTGPFPGGSGQSSTIDYDTIEESSIQTIANSAESPTAGIQLSVVTKSGGNAFHGGGFISQFPTWMQSDNVDDALRAQGITLSNRVEQRYDVSGEFSGRIVPDKLWFYGTGRQRKDASVILGVFLPDGSPAIYTLVQKFLVGKATYQMTSSQKIVGAYHWSTRNVIEGQDLNRFTAYESRGARAQNANVAKIEWQLAKGNKFYSFQFGGWQAPSIINPTFSNNPTTQDLNTSLITGANVSAGIENNFGRKDARATVNWYKPNLFVGGHDFKAGVNVFRARGNINTYDLGPEISNSRLLFTNTVPFEINARNAPVKPLSNLDYFGAFLQDSWTIHRRLTLNLGIRYARDAGWNPEQCRAAAPAPLDGLYPEACFAEVRLKVWNPVTPRLHAAYDVTGDGKTVIKGGWGRFALMRGQDDLTTSNQNSDISTLFRWHDLNNDKLFQPGEVDLRPNGLDFVSSSITDVGSLSGFVQNPNLKEPGSNEYSLSLERQLMPNFALRVTGVYSQDFNTLRILNILRPYGAYNIPITNPIPDPTGAVLPGNPYGTLTYYDYPVSLWGLAFQQPTFINDPNANANYGSIEIAGSKRLSNHWQLLASYSATKLHVPYGANIGLNQKAVAATTFDPNAEIFAANYNWEWATRVSGSYEFPADTLVSANFENRSGEPWARTALFRGGQQIPSITLRVEPIGAQRLPSVNILTLRAEKAFRLGQSHRIAVQLQVFNALNGNDVATTLNPPVPQLNALSGPNFGKTTAIIPPRIGEINIRYTF